jgi:hypothetical protein
VLVSVARISQRSFLRTVTFGSAALTVKGSGLAQSLTRSAKPNLLVFLPDELRADLIVGESAGSLHAPHLHQLASESVIFERAYITHPICSPSRSSLLTGTWPHQTGCMDNAGVLPTKFRCLPEMVGDSAYRTGYFGKWHLGDEFFPQHGFQKWASIEDSFKSADSGRKKKGQSDYTEFLLSKGYKPDLHNGQSFNLELPTTLPFELSKSKFIGTERRLIARTSIAYRAKIDIAIKQSRLASKQDIETCLRENELYNLREDPQERRNLFSDDSHRDVISRS